ncbi:hypothetical protein HH214_10755 [Mucilaginibacter robiniae]|uniref:Uncharacterized protein n=1 Tax=Mucilaginibacter robiniae TaxID=2728022 RepID=A0A7L5DYY2_9SPHI|nr:hypothetical protein [Mucilaginibacter robiniae]QJD96310.1 hypothetical protein HH214_10755 [Mucilaginibacter robiniae]
MKKALKLLFVVVILGVLYLIYDDLSFDPLNRADFAKIFVGYNGKTKLDCKKDFTGITTSGGFFELYVYSLGDVKVNNNYPQFNNWENSTVTRETTIGKWRNCPINKDVIKLYRFTIGADNLNTSDCAISFKNEILNPRNFYSYISINDTEQYFFLYSSATNKFYYIRRKE